MDEKVLKTLKDTARKVRRLEVETKFWEIRYFRPLDLHKQIIVDSQFDKAPILW